MCNTHTHTQVLDSDDNAACGSTHTLAGRKGHLTALEHVAPGARVSIVDDCTVRITNFTYDGEAPDGSWIAAAANTASSLEAGQTLSAPLRSAVNGSDVTLRLKPGE